MAASGEVGAEVSQATYSCRSLSTSGETCAVAAPAPTANAPPATAPRASRVNCAPTRTAPTLHTRRDESPRRMPGSALLQRSHQHDGRCRLCGPRFGLDRDGRGTD